MIGYPYSIFVDPNLVNNLTNIRFELGQQLEKQLDLRNKLLEMNSTGNNKLQHCPTVKIQEVQNFREEQGQSNDQIQNSPKQTSIRKRTIKKQVNCGVKNDTKNIPKNYGKAILSFIQKNSFKAKKLCQLHKVSFAEFMIQVRKKKTKINSIADLRGLWGQDDKDNGIKKCFRVLSYQFMRKFCLMYIFHSRVKNYGTHIKYRRKIIEGIQKPEQFTNIKEY